jgi:hypothetical protein
MGSPVSAKKPSNSFEREIKAFLSAVVPKLEVFAPHHPKLTEFPEHSVAKSTLDNLFRQKNKRLTRGTARTLALRLQYFLDQNFTIRTPHDLAQRLSEYGCDKVSFVRFTKGRFVIDASELIRLYGHPHQDHPAPEPEPVAQRPAGSGRVVLSITMASLIEAVTASQQDRLIDSVLSVLKATQPVQFLERLTERLADSLGYVIVRSVQEGCTTLQLEVSRLQAKEILGAFRSGEFADVGVISVEESDPGAFEKRGFRIDPNSPGARENLAKQWREAVRREGYIRPWRRLLWLFSPAVRLSPLAHVIGDSDQRAYAAVGLLGRWKSLMVDLSMAGILWPLLTAVLLAITLTPLRLVFPFVSADVGIATGLILSLAGAQVCAAVISPIAVGAGAIIMGWAFGLAHAFAWGRLGRSEAVNPFDGAHVRSDLFRAIAGGPIGLSAPQWPNNLPALVIVLLLMAVGGSIAIAGWLMGQPRNAAGCVARSQWAWFDNHPTLAGMGCGILAGSLIGLVYGFDQALATVIHQHQMEPAMSFVGAFAVLGGVVFGVTTWARTGSCQKGVRFAILHASFAVALCVLVIRVPNGLPLLMALSAASAFFHATWFTAAFVLGEKLGSVRAAVTATTVEGALGFTAFVIFRMIHG